MVAIHSCLTLFYFDTPKDPLYAKLFLNSLSPPTQVPLTLLSLSFDDSLTNRFSVALKESVS